MMTRTELIRQLQRRRVSVEQKGDELKMNCPVCGDQRGRLFFNTVLQRGHCQNECGGFSRQRFDDTFGLVDLDASSRSDVAELLERALQSENGDGPRQGPPGSPFPISSAVMAWRHPASWGYLQSRPTPVTRAQAQRYFLTYVPSCRRHNDRFDLTCVSCDCQRRLVIPIVRVGLIARDVTKESPLKDKTLPGCKIRTTLYSIERLRSKRVVLFEGVFDYYALEGHLPVLATFGTALSETQLRRLLMIGVEEVVLLWDGDAAGRNAAERTAKRIQSQVRVRIAELQEGKNPDQLPSDQVQAIVRRAPLLGDVRRQLRKAGL
jgi:hypothetical protein